MTMLAANFWRYRELISALAMRDITVRYKQSYLGILWAILKPVSLMLIFTVVRSFIGIDSGDVPYPILTFAALMPWILFQDATSAAVSSIVGNSSLIRKIYFPREIFPVVAVTTRVIELLINFLILAGLMVWFKMIPTVYVLWIPVIILYVLILSLGIGFLGAAGNVYYRDVSVALPVFVSFLMYLSPVIYPLSLVKQKLLEEQIAGEWSIMVYNVYICNPLVGIIDSFQRCLLQGLPPDFTVLGVGALITLFLFIIGYVTFKRAESYFADVI